MEKENEKITLSEYIRIYARRAGVDLGELARRLGMSQQNLSNKLARDRWRMDEAREALRALGYDMQIDIIPIKEEDRPTV